MIWFFLSVFQTSQVVVNFLMGKTVNKVSLLHSAKTSLIIKQLSIAKTLLLTKHLFAATTLQQNVLLTKDLSAIDRAEKIS